MSTKSLRIKIRRGWWDSFLRASYKDRLMHARAILHGEEPQAAMLVLYHRDIASFDKPRERLPDPLPSGISIVDSRDVMGFRVLLVTSSMLPPVRSKYSPLLGHSCPVFFSVTELEGYARANAWRRFLLL